MAATRNYVFEKPAGGRSDPMNLTKLMAACARNVKVGAGAFIVIRGAQFRHPNLSREEALVVFRECMRAIPIGSGVKVLDAKGDKVFHAYRVPIVTYRNPFRDVLHLATYRIDAGVDYGGDGPVYALGKGVLTHVGTPSHSLTFGNDLSIYQLSDGPAKGKFVYFAEQYDNHVGLHNGMELSSDTVLYHMNGFIEIGWSDGQGSMAWDLDNGIEGQRTVWGQNFSDLLEALDCPPGEILGRPLTMTLPPGWPTDWAV